MKISVNSRVRSMSKISDIFSICDEIYLAFTEQCFFFFFFFFLIFFLSGKTKGKQTASKFTVFLVISRQFCLVQRCYWV